MPFKANRDCRRRIPKQRHRVTNWVVHDVDLLAQGRLTVCFTTEAIEYGELNRRWHLRPGCGLPSRRRGRATARECGTERSRRDRADTVRPVSIRLACSRGVRYLALE